MIDTTYQIIEQAQDTIYLAVDSTSNNAGDVSGNYKVIITAIASLISAGIGAMVTLLVKKKEFQNFKENLNLQKQLFEETKARNENEIKAELVRLKNLSNQYKLNLAKFDFEHLEKILEFGNDKDEKVAMLKDLAKQLDDFNPEIPDWVDDYYDYQVIVVDHTYYRLDDINKNLNELLKTHVTAFSSLHDQIKKVAGNASILKRESTQYFMDIPGSTDEYVIKQLFDSLFNLYKDYNGLVELLKSEFKELDKMKREFIREQAKKSGHSEESNHKNEE